MKTKIISELDTVIISLVLVTIASCTTVNFKEPVASYTKSVAESGQIFTKYYSLQNETQRKFYLFNFKYNKTLRMEAGDAGGYRTGLYFYYSPQTMKARLESLRLISAYGERLTVLAGDELPKQLSDKGAAIISDAGLIVAKLRNVSPEEAVQNANFLKNTETLGSALIKMYAEHRQSETLRVAIGTGHDAVKSMLLIIQDDLVMFSQQISAKYSNQLAHMVKLYNEQIQASIPMESDQAIRVRAREEGRQVIPSSTLTEPQRVELLNQIQLTAGLYESSIMNRPDDVVSAMIKANDELYNYSLDPSGESSLEALNLALESFNSSVQPFVDFYVNNRN
jgi:hypothetical protein